MFMLFAGGQVPRGRGQQLDAIKSHLTSPIKGTETLLPYETTVASFSVVITNIIKGCDGSHSIMVLIPFD